MLNAECHRFTVSVINFFDFCVVFIIFLAEGIHTLCVFLAHVLGCCAFTGCNADLQGCKKHYIYIENLR